MIHLLKIYLLSICRCIVAAHWHQTIMPFRCPSELQHLSSKVDHCLTMNSHRRPLAALPRINCVKLIRTWASVHRLRRPFRVQRPITDIRGSLSTHRHLLILLYHHQLHPNAKHRSMAIHRNPCTQHQPRLWTNTIRPSICNACATNWFNCDRRRARAVTLAQTSRLSFQSNRRPRMRSLTIPTKNSKWSTNSKSWQPRQPKRSQWISSNQRRWICWPQTNCTQHHGHSTSTADFCKPSNRGRSIDSNRNFPHPRQRQQHHQRHHRHQRRRRLHRRRRQPPHRCWPIFRSPNWKPKPRWTRNWRTKKYWDRTANCFSRKSLWWNQAPHCQTIRSIRRHISAYEATKL